MRRLNSLVLVLSGLAVFSANAQDVLPFPPPPDDISSTAILATREESGERLLIRGTVYHADGTAPFKGLIIYLYQTDASGVYNHANRSWREPRLRGWLKTGDRGEYEIQTIKPGSYPGSRNPAHIHAIIRLPGDAPEWIDDFLFDGDPFLTDQQQQESLKKGKFANIMKLTRSGENALTGTRDIKIDE